MPKKPIDYSKAIIYKICCKDVEITDCYVGSTTNLEKRKGTHKSVCNNDRDKSHNLNVYQFIRASEGWENWEFVLVEEYPCETKFQLESRERYWLETLGATLNKYIPTRTLKEWVETNKGQLSEYHKEYYEDNKEKILEYTKEYRKNNKDKISEYYEKNKDKISEYRKKHYEDNKEKISEKNKKYREANKDKIYQQKNQKHTCVCGKE